MFFKPRSLRANFIIKLTSATVLLEFLFSIVFYTYINISVNNELKESIVKQGKYLFSTYSDVAKVLEDKKNILQETMKLQVKIISLPDENYQSVHFRQFRRDGNYYLEAYFPYEFALQRYLILTADITKQKRVENKVTRAIIVINIFGMIGILIYAFFLSNMLIAPIRVFNQKLAKMNEMVLLPIGLKGIPEEFLPLGQSVNSLIGRIQSFINYKKELFVGTAHELKTPLAVIKAKSQVAILKKSKSKNDLVEALKQSINSVDDMNKIVSSILEFGRAEGAQFEKPETVDLIAFLKKICDEFGILADRENKVLKCKLNPSKQTIVLPELLLRQIIQNLLQNAIKFTEAGKVIRVSSYIKKGKFVIKVRDEGSGIDEDMDLFAPFKRSSESSGAGLGLFLVKSATDALQAEIGIKNRIDNKGTVATLSLPI